MKSADKNSELIETFLEPIRKCAKYKPAFGQSKGKGLEYSDFQKLYGEDVFYHWLGLDDASVYAAHKAAGGLTSVYRQIGIGSERLFRSIIMNSFQLTKEQVAWSYEYLKANGKSGTHTLDGLIANADLSAADQVKFTDWLKEACKFLGVDSQKSKLHSAAFEVRQGYKSADSKRQNADLRFGMRAYQAQVLPVFAVLSSQVSFPVIKRYQSDGMLILRGTLEDDPMTSTFAFSKDVLDFNLENFFKTNQKTFKKEVTTVVEKLLST